MGKWSGLRERFWKEGFALLRSGVPQDMLATFAREALLLRQQTLETRSPSIRNLLQRSSLIRLLAHRNPLMEVAQSILGGPATPIKGTFFEKGPEANWTVPYHQDLTICVREKRELPGFGPWSVKEGVHNVQAPPELIEKSVALRIHLDDCPPEAGALQVVPGSHLLGRIEPDRLAAVRGELGEIVCPASAGDVLLMSPLLLHRSNKATLRSQRRVVHLEYSTAELPGGLRWL